MELSLTAADAAFRDEVRGFLAQHLTPALREAGAKTGGVFSAIEAQREWHRILHGRGWSAPSWPKAHGGPGWSALQRWLFARESAAADAPKVLSMGVKMVGPVVMRYGTPEQQRHYLPRILSGEDFWCQGYSEPGAGSDLASLKTRAVEDGEDFIVTGTKIWTTLAHHANRMFCLVRTSAAAKPQEGITFLLIDAMAQPGITVQPIITLAGDHEVNQVFLDGVRVPKKNVVGRVGDGWTVAKYLLEYERGGDAFTPGLYARLADVRRIAGGEASGGERLIDDAGFARRLGEAEIAVRALEMLELQVLSEVARGRNPGAASSVMKVRGSETLQQIDELGIEALGWYAAPFEPEALALGRNLPAVAPEPGLTAMPLYLNNRAASIYAGSNEIQRNIIAKAVLGL